MSDPAAAIRRALDTLAVDLPALTIGLTPTGAGYRPPPHERIPGGLLRLHLAENAQAVLHAWCRVVIETRPAVGPRGSGPAACIRWLRPHVGWLAEHDPDAADAAAAEIGALAGSVRRAVAPTGPRRIPVGACPVTDCQGALWAVLSDHPRPAPGVTFTSQTDAGDLAAPPVTCDDDPDHTWVADDPWLAQLLGVDGPRRQTATQWAAWITRHQGAEVPDSTIRSWARRHPATIGWDPATATLDRVATTMHWLTTRSNRRAS